MAPKIKCQFCSETFGTARTYYAHARKEHLDIILDKDGGWIKCDVCHECYPDWQTLYDHQRIKCKLRPQCEFCNMKIDRKLYLEHARVNHTEQVDT
jgi:hypothetical protein